MSAGWVRWTLAVVMAAVALYHLGRLARRHLPSRYRTLDADLSHAAMGTVMALMLVGSLGPSGSRRLALLFAVPVLWFVARGLYGYVLDGPRAAAAPARQVVACVAMVYMLALAGSGTALAGASMSGMAMPHTAAGTPVVIALLVLLTLVVAAWSLVRLRPRMVGVPTLSTGCQVAMNVTAAAMLLAM